MMALAILLLTTIFVATTGDSMSYAIAVVSAGHDEPEPVVELEGLEGDADLLRHGRSRGEEDEAEEPLEHRVTGDEGSRTLPTG